MANAVYVDHDGVRHEVNIPLGMNLMEGARNNGVVGIEGDCGGAAACATCHVYVALPWREAAGTPSPTEIDMLDCANDVDERSRLSCQIVMSDALDGIEVALPESQR